MELSQILSQFPVGHGEPLTAEEHPDHPGVIVLRDKASGALVYLMSEEDYLALRAYTPPA